MEDAASWFKHRSGNWLTGGVHLFILFGAVQANSAAVWPYALGLMALISFVAWIENYRRYRQIEDTPTSKIASAAQGYVELVGHAECPGGTPLTSRITGAPCIWFYYEIWEKRAGKDEWSLNESGTSDEPFLIRDATGECVIDPEGAEVDCSRKRTWTEGDQRYTEWLLLPRDNVCALGEFTTIGGADGVLDFDGDVSALLTEWKKDQPELLRRFDLNQDGSIDSTEWQLARHEAQREVEKAHREIRASPGTNMLRKPADGRPFLLSSRQHDALAAHYHRWGWGHLAVFFGAGFAALMLV